MDKRIALTFKLYYFLRFIGQGIFYPFLVLFLTDKGITGRELSLLLMLLPLGRIVLSPIAGYICDLYRIHKQVLMVSVITISAGAFYLAKAPFSFTNYFLAALIITLGEVSVDSLINTLVLDYLSRYDQKTSFGQWRMWGAVGFMVGSFLLGMFSLDHTLDLIPILFAIANLLAFFAVFPLPKTSPQKPLDWTGGYRLVTQNKAFAVLLIGIIFTGLSMNIVFMYFSVYMNELGAASWMIGLGVAFQTVVEILLSANTKGIMDRFPLRWLYLSGFAVLPIRILLYLFNRSSFIALLIQNFHGLSIFSAFIVGLIILDLNLKPEWRSTGQSYYYSAFGGFGAMLGSLIAPLVYDSSGISTLWVFSLIISLLGFGFIHYTSIRMIPGKGQT